MQDLICIFGFEERINYWNLFSLLLAGIQAIQNYYSNKSKLTYILKLSNSDNLTRKKHFYRKSFIYFNKILNVSIFFFSILLFVGMAGEISIYLFYLKHVFELKWGP